MESIFLLAALAVVNCIDVECPFVLIATHHRLINQCCDLQSQLPKTSLVRFGSICFRQVRAYWGEGTPHLYLSGYNIWDNYGMMTTRKEQFLPIVDCFFAV